MHSSVAWSYSLYGKDLNYYKPLLSNILIAKEKGIKVYISVLESEYHFIKSFFSDLSQDIIFIKYDDNYRTKEKLLRYLSISLIECDIIHFKDSDSLVTNRELSYMKYWESSTYDSLIIRDHPLHYSKILAGLFSIKKNKCQWIYESCEIFMKKTNVFKKHSYNYDQIWLGLHIYPRIKTSSIIFSNSIIYKNEQFYITPRFDDKIIGGNNNENFNFIDRELMSKSDKYLLRIPTLEFLPDSVKKILFNRTRGFYILFKLFSKKIMK